MIFYLLSFCYHSFRVPFCQLRSLNSAIKKVVTVMAIPLTLGCIFFPGIFMCSVDESPYRLIAHI